MNSWKIGVAIAPLLIAGAALAMRSRYLLSTGATALVLIVAGAIAALFLTM